MAGLEAEYLRSELGTLVWETGTHGSNLTCCATPNPKQSACVRTHGLCTKVKYVCLTTGQLDFVSLSSNKQMYFMALRVAYFISSSTIDLGESFNFPEPHFLIYSLSVVLNEVYILFQI